MKDQCTTQEWVFVHVHVDYFTKYRQRCIDIEKNWMHHCNERQSYNRQLFYKNIFLNRKENRRHHIKRRET